MSQHYQTFHSYGQAELSEEISGTEIMHVTVGNMIQIFQFLNMVLPSKVIPLTFF